MRIVFLRTTDIAPDPRVEKEAYSLIKNGHDVIVVGWDRNSNHEFEETRKEIKETSISLYRIGIKSIYGGSFKNIIPLILFQKAIAKWLWKNRDKYDCIHACDLNTGFTALLMAKLLRKKIVYDIFDYFPDAYPVPKKIKGLIRKIEDFVIYNSNAVIICTEQRIKQINYKGDLSKLYIIHNSPKLISDFENQKFSRTQKKEKIRIVYVGILQSERYIHEMIDIVSRHPEYELHIGGFGLLEDYIKEKAETYENIIFYGKLQYEDTLALENTADILPALYRYNDEHKYAAPNKFYEALMLAKPLLMAHDTGMDHVVIENSIGVVVGYHETNLENSLKRLVDMKDQWNDISQRMRIIYKEKYSWDIMEKRLVKLYKSI